MTPCIVVDKYGISENPAAATFRMYEDGSIFFLKRLYLPTSLLGITSQKTRTCTFYGFVTQPINSTNMNPLNFSADVNIVLKVLAARSVI
jgi:hypothetical protein